MSVPSRLHATQLVRDAISRGAVNASAGATAFIQLQHQASVRFARRRAYIILRGFTSEAAKPLARFVEKCSHSCISKKPTQPPATTETLPQRWMSYNTKDASAPDLVSGALAGFRACTRRGDQPVVSIHIFEVIDLTHIPQWFVVAS
jgi:hypothetical protein